MGRIFKIILRQRPADVITIIFLLFLLTLDLMFYPALGPRFTITHLQTAELQGFIVAEPIQKFLNR